MKSRLVIFTIVLAGLLAAGCQTTKYLTTTTSPNLSALDETVLSGIEDGIYPGAVLVVGKPDRVLFAKTYGRHTYEKDSPPMSFDTIFDLASVSKVVGTSLAAFVNLEEGKIALEDRVADHIPGFEKNEKGDVRIKDLMTHVSGLPPYENWKKVEEKRREGESHADALIRHYSEMPLNYEPRSKSRYSCLNFQTTARVNENASGERQEDILIRAVYGPLGMTDTRYVLTREQRIRTAPTIRRKDGSLVKGDVHDPLANYHESIEHCPGNAGLYSTAPDMMKFCRMVLGEGMCDGKRIYSEKTIRRATRRQTPDNVDIYRGIGFQLYTSPPWMTDLNRKPETRIVGHYGYTGPFFWIDKFSKTYIVFLTNRTFPYREDVTDQAPKDSHIRRKLCDIVLRSLPEYQYYYSRKEKND